MARFGWDRLFLTDHSADEKDQSAGSRPTLEDLLEFVILEEMAKPHKKWEQVIAKHRDRWENLQLRAAVRSNPTEAAEELRASGWQVTAPA